MTRLARLKQLALWEGGLPLLWLALAAVQLVPILNNRMLPMLEAPRDLALARVWHSARAADWRVGEFYTPLYRLWPGTLIYYLLDLLLYLMPIEATEKVLLCCYLLLFPVALGLLARALGRSVWLGVLAFPLLFNRAFIFGYTGTLLGGALVFLALAALLAYLDHGRRQLALIILSLLAFLANLATFTVFLISAAGMIWLSRRRKERVRGALFALGPALALTFSFLLDAGGEKLPAEDWLATFKDLPALIGEFPKRVLDVMPGSIDMKLLTLLFGTLVVLCVWKGVREGGEAPERRRLLVLIVTCFFAYSLFPWDLREPLYEPGYAARLAPLLAATLLLLPRRPLGGAQRLVLLPIIAASVYLPLKLNKLYRDFSRRNSGFIRLAHELPRGSSSITLIAGLRYSRESIDLGQRRLGARRRLLELGRLAAGAQRRLRSLSPRQVAAGARRPSAQGAQAAPARSRSAAPGAALRLLLHARRSRSLRSRAGAAHRRSIR